MKTIRPGLLHVRLSLPRVTVWQSGSLRFYEAAEMHMSLDRVVELAESGVISKSQSWTLAILNEFEATPAPKESKIVRHRAKGGVYFLQCGCHIKIGWTKAIGERIRTLQCACPEKIQLLHLDEFLERKDESILHSLFRKNRSYGEWFYDDSREIEAYILSRYEVCHSEYKMIELINKAKRSGNK